MTIAAADVLVLPGRPRRQSVRLLAGDAARHAAAPDNLWYRFIVTDGTDTDYYADDTAGARRRPRRDDRRRGRPELGADASTCPASPRRPGRRTPSSTRSSPTASATAAATTTRRPATSATTIPVVKLRLGRRCPRATAATTPTRRHDLPVRASPRRRRRPTRSPRGRDYYGGDLKGVDQQLDYLAGARRHRDLLQPDLRRRLEPRLRHAGLHARSTRTSARRRTSRTSSSTRTTRGIRVILDGVFNHMSLRQPVLRPLPPLRDGGRLRVDDLAVPLVVHVPRRRAGQRHVRRHRRQHVGDLRRLVRVRLDPGAAEDAGRRPGVLPDRHRQRREALAPGRRVAAGGSTSPATRPSRTATGRRSARSSRRPNPSALTISETWQKDSTLLRMLRGDRLDTTMNYRLRDAVLALLAPQAVRPEGLRRQRPRDPAVGRSSTGSRRSARTTRTPRTTR